MEREDPGVGLGQAGHLPVGGGLAVGDPGGHAARQAVRPGLAPLVDVPDLDEVPLTPEELEELERLEAIVEVLEKRVEELEAKKRSPGASRMTLEG